MMATMKRVTLSRVKPTKGLLVLLVLISTIHCVYLSEKYGGRDMVDLYVALIIAGRWNKKCNKQTTTIKSKLQL